MTEKQRFVDGNLTGRRYEYDGRSGLVADLGPSAEGSVDLVGDTAIVVVGDDQYEFEVPAGVTTRASMNNGVLTVEVEQPGAESETGDGTESDTEADD
ncbi:MAG: hypothetical protein V5A62_04705 [Haloarculaceae archaeon]